VIGVASAKAVPRSGETTLVCDGRCHGDWSVTDCVTETLVCDGLCHGEWSVTDGVTETLQLNWDEPCDVIGFRCP